MDAAADTGLRADGRSGGLLPVGSRCRRGPQQGWRHGRSGAFRKSARRPL